MFRRILDNLIRFRTGTVAALPALVARAARLEADGNLDAAARTYEQALARHAGSAVLHTNLGTLYKRQGRLAEAGSHYRRAVELEPALTGAWYNLGLTLHDNLQLEEASNAFWRALAHAQDAQAGGYLPALCTSQALTLQMLGRHRQARAFLQEAGQRFPEIAGECARCALFSLNFIEDTDPAAAMAEHRTWARRHADPLTRAADPVAAERSPERPLRVGYVSGDFRAHPTASFVGPLLRHHDRSSFDIYCYDNSPAPDAMSASLRQSPATWRNIRGMGDDEVARLIRGDGVDILVDLAGHTAHNRLMVFARKPAPLQIGYLGYLATTGLRALDYRLTDAVADPPAEADPFHSEALLRLPDTQWCWEPPHIAPPVAAPPSGRHGHVRFGSFTQFAKLTDSMLDTWAQLLLAVPESRLCMVGVPGRTAAKTILAKLAASGVPGRRVEIAARLDYREYLAAVSEADVALDAFPYNGATTTCEALWMGVPVVSRAGRLGPARSGASILRVTGLGELVADSARSYIEIAVRLARDPVRLELLRNGMRARMLASPLMNGARFTKDLEKLYRKAWGDYCSAPVSVKASENSRDST